jgi:hypothetical protein
MKVSFPLCAVFAAFLAAGSLQAATLISDFNSFSTQLFPPMFISWTNGGTDQYVQNAGSISITPVSGGNPLGDGYFIAGLPGNPGSTINLSGMSLASLNGSVDAGNASSFVKVTFLDSSLTAVGSATFLASGFNASLSTQTASISLTGVGNLNAVTYWRMDGDGIASDAFRYSFNDLSVAAVPEPSTALTGLAGLGIAGFALRRRLKKAARAS